MINNKKIVVVLPAYNAESSLKKTYDEIPFDIVDDVILVDDLSSDKTVEIATQVGIKHIIIHDNNTGYGGNQKTCYRAAIEQGADIIVMLHPDYQYTPRLIHSMCALISNNVYKVVFGSRILGRGAIKGGMPLYKYIINRILTFFQNVMLQQKLSEYHTGYRAFSREVLETIRYELNSDNYIFDNQIIMQIFNAGFEIAEISCPTRYSGESSSINFWNSIIYGLGVIKTTLMYFFHRCKIVKLDLYQLKKHN